MRTRLTWIFTAALLMVMLVSTSAWEDSMPLVAEILFAVSTLLIAVGVVGRLWCSLYIAGYKNKELITEGPYSLCRNPLYFCSLLGGIGIGLASETLTIPCIILVAFAAYYPLVIRREEKRMQLLHGESYAKYMLSVPRFFPRLGNLSEPETYVVKPIAFRRNIATAVWFVGLIGAIELVEALHELHVLPVLMSIY